MKRLVFASLAALIGLGAVLLVIRTVMAAPTNEDVAQRFNQKKKIYEQLREMLIEDKEIRQIAPWGTRTTTAPMGQMPPVAELPLERYQEYLALLSDIGATGMLRSDGDDPKICILVWASGWAANTVHVSVCWLGHDTPASTSTASRRFSRSSLSSRWYVERDDQ
jgi:hypothetical protein